ncbi:NAD(P)-dependent oxidoreductase [Peribacillus sp. NPDC097675]|uniref:NAD(P)-dependent oxidoreductase n=1 Tax=Peribacillus sp. NPDC097675 TaxID=3390618 RepID=UPI003D001330
MNIIVFGASGKTGKLVVEQALNLQHKVTAFVRNPTKLQINHPNLQIIQGDALDEEAVQTAVSGQEVVISCLGSSSGLGKTTVLHEMTQIIVNAMKAKHVSRIIYMASAGIDKEIPGLIGKLTMKMLGNVLEDHHNAVEVIKKNDLIWTVARPMGLSDNPPTGSYREELQGIPKGSRSISRADVADFIIRALTDEKYLNQSVALGN